MWTHCIPDLGILNLPFASAHDETRKCIFAAFRMPIVDARIRRDRSTWSIYYSLFQYRRCDRQSVDVKSQFSRFILSKGIFVHYLHYLTQKRIKNVIPQTTPLRTRTILRSLDKRSILSLGASSSSFPFFVVAFLFSRRARLDGLLCFFFLYLSQRGGTFLFWWFPSQERARWCRAQRVLLRILSIPDEDHDAAMRFFVVSLWHQKPSSKRRTNARVKEK